MPKIQYALEPGAPKRLVIQRGTFSDRLTLTFDGAPLAELRMREVKKTARQIALPDGTTLSVKSTPAVTGYQLELRRNGQPLPGSSTDPETMVKGGAYTLYVVAALTVLFALLSGVITGGTEAEDVGAIVGIAVSAALYAVLGFFASRGWMSAMIIGLVLYAADAFYTAFEASSVGVTNPARGIFLKIIIMVFLVRGIQGAWQLRKARQADARLATESARPAA